MYKRQASDLDTENNTVTYTLSDDSGGRFAIDETTGVVSVADATLLDYETAVSHDITVLASSSDGSTASETFTINVVNYEPPNQPPVADDDFYPGTVVAGETITIDAATLLANDYDPDGDHSNLQVTSVTLLSGDGEFVDNGNGTWTITPAVDFVGDASLSYTVEDADGGTSTATATITVTPYVAPNEPPVADDSVSFTMSEDGTLLIEEAALLGSSSDPDNDVLHIENLELGLSLIHI
mgnify:FL=1